MIRSALAFHMRKTDQNKFPHAGFLGSFDQIPYVIDVGFCQEHFRQGRKKDTRQMHHAIYSGADAFKRAQSAEVSAAAGYILIAVNIEGNEDLCTSSRNSCDPFMRCCERWEPRLPDAPAMRSFTQLPLHREPLEWTSGTLENFSLVGR